nr:hypothetical protein GCM10020092_095350 [Actinoplanes digitatis]
MAGTAMRAASGGFEPKTRIVSFGPSTGSSTRNPFNSSPPGRGTGRSPVSPGASRCVMPTPSGSMTIHRRSPSETTGLHQRLVVVQAVTTLDRVRVQRADPHPTSVCGWPRTRGPPPDRAAES